jgi:hypothetical protein
MLMIYVIYRKYNFNTYIKIHPCVNVEYLWDVSNLVTITTNGMSIYSWMKINLKAIQPIG